MDDRILLLQVLGRESCWLGVLFGLREQFGHGIIVEIGAVVTRRRCYRCGLVARDLEACHTAMFAQIVFPVVCRCVAISMAHVMR